MVSPRWVGVRHMRRGIALGGSDVEMLALSVSGGGEGKVG